MVGGIVGWIVSRVVSWTVSRVVGQMVSGIRLQNRPSEKYLEYSVELTASLEDFPLAFRSRNRFSCFS